MRGWWIAKWERDRDKCPQHGGPRSECSDPDQDWFPQRTVCRSRMNEEAAKRLYARLHEALPFHDGTFTQWAKDPSRDFPFHFNDGVTIWASSVDLSPDDTFLADASSSADPRGGDDDGDEA